MDEFRDAYGKNTTPEAEYQNGYMDGYVAGKEACADEIARLQKALQDILDIYGEDMPAGEIAVAVIAKKEEK